jgi:hypothetical protein
MQDSLPAGGLRLYREGVEPSGSLRKVSGYISILLSRTSPVARVVYAKRPFGGPQQVLDYLGRYTHRVAIANSRLVDLVDGQVRFRWKDYRQSDKPKVMTLEADEFIRRFLIHVLPDGFRRIRHLGFLANTHRSIKLTTIRALLDVTEPDIHPDLANYRERYALLTGRSLDICPCCGGTMIEITRLARAPSWSPAVLVRQLMTDFLCDTCRPTASTPRTPSPRTARCHRMVELPPSGEADDHKGADGAIRHTHANLWLLPGQIPRAPRNSHQGS